jgi:hypothetical protein
MRFSELLDLLIEQHKIKNLSTEVDIRQISSDMEDVERLFPYYLRQDADDLVSDSKNPGFLGFGIFDENSDVIGGYIMGNYPQSSTYYDLNYLDFEHILFHDENLRNEMIYSTNRGEDRMTFLRRMLENKSMYVSNLAVKPPYRSAVYRLLFTFIDACRQRGIKYLLFDAMPDTINLLKSRRLLRNNIKILAEVDSDADRRFFLLEI